jgi:hypothetical protein
MGFADNGTLCGYAWTATNGEGETIDPPCGSDACFTDDICATGSLPANDADAGSYTGIMIGWNVAQAEGSSSSSSWKATGAGITVSYTKNAAATGEVRVMVQAGGKDFCAPDVASGTSLDWSDFSVECWEGGDQSPKLTAGTEIDAIAIQLNGDTAAQDYELCLTDVENY